MKHPRFVSPWLLSVAMTVAAGCAPAYHEYSGCCVDCGYCPPPPLPYTQYDECVCHSCAVSNYLTAAPQPVAEDAPGEATGD